jgi:hypothetical protein
MIEALPTALANSTCWYLPMPRRSTKAKAWEYPAVVIPVVTQHYAMLQRNLLLHRRYSGQEAGRIGRARRRLSLSLFATLRGDADGRS